MTGYLISFSIYTTAMIGVIFLALYTFKKFSNGGLSKKSSVLNIEDTMRLSPRKSLYIINVKNEKFLIASDIDRTSLLAKLDSNSESENETLSTYSTNVIKTREDKSSTLKDLDGLESIEDFTSILDFNKKKTSKGPMMKELAKKLNTL